MARYVLIRLTETQFTSANVEGAEWVLVDKSDPQHMIEKGTLYEPPVLGLGDKVVVCIPASKVMLTRVSLPNSNINRIRKIVPFALEEFILDDLDDVHFAVGHLEKGEDTSVAVIQNSLLTQNLNSIEALGLNPTVMIPDCVCLPYDKNSWTIFVENDMALVRTGNDIGFSCNIDVLILMLTQYIKEEYVSQPEILKSYNVPQEIQSEIMNISFETEVEYFTFEVTGNTEMLFLEQYIETTPGINLLQGNYSRRQKMGQQLRPWIPLAVLLSAWIVLAFVIDIVNYNKLSSKVAALNQEQVTIFKGAFPNARKFNNPRAQMESRLKQLQKKVGKSSSSAITMLVITAKVLRQYKIVGIKTVRYRNNLLDIDVNLKSLQMLDVLKDKLSNNGQWKVEVKSATSRDNFVESRIQIKG